MTENNENLDGAVEDALIEETPATEEAAPAAEEQLAAEEQPVVEELAEGERPETAAPETAVAEDAPVEESVVVEPGESAEPTADVDPARKAELDALAAELQGGKVEKKPAKRTRRATTKGPVEPVAEPAAEASEPAEPVESVSAEPATEDATEAEAPEGDESAEGATGDGGSARSRSRRGRNRNRSGNGEKPEGQQAAGQPAQASDEERPQQDRSRERNKRGRGQSRHDDELEPEILPDDVLLPIAGILDVLDNYAFVRTTGYLPGVTDVYVSLGQVKKYGLRKGDAVVGAIRQPREGEQQGRQKYNALVKVDSVNGQTADASLARPEFAAGTPVLPSAKLAIKTTAKGVELGKGQRALVTGGTAAGKTRLVAELAESLSANHPDAHLMVILAGVRPEEATEFRRKVKGEVIVSTFDQGAEDLVTVAELAVERAKRLVELGLDVVVLIDSVTQLARAYFSLAPVSRAHADDPTFLLPAKRLFGAARAIEDGATLTIVATGSSDLSLDQLAITELSAVANSVIAL